MLSRKIIMDNDNDDMVIWSILAYYFIDTNKTLRLFNSTKRWILVTHTLQSISFPKDDIIIKLVLWRHVAEYWSTYNITH